MNSLIIPWSEKMSDEELHYKNQGFVKTKMSVFNVKQPNRQDLIDAFNFKPKDLLSLGAIALCSHSSRNSEYPKCFGSGKNKNIIAEKFLKDFLNEPAAWKNIHKLNNNIVYEIRNSKNYGMRWYITPDSVKFRGLLEPYCTYLEYCNKKKV